MVPNPQVLDLIKEEFGVVSMLTTISKSGNRHLWIKTKVSMGVVERVAIQACAGSDPMREALSLVKRMSNCEVSLAIFETPDQAAAVETWRGMTNSIGYTQPEKTPQAHVTEIGKWPDKKVSKPAVAGVATFTDKDLEDIFNGV